MLPFPIRISPTAPGLWLLLSLAMPGESASLDELIRAGLEKNRALAAGRQDVETASLDTLAVATAVNPHLEVEAMHNLEEPERPTAGVRLSKTFQPGIRNRMKIASKADWEARGAWLKVQELDLVERIRTAYYDWQILDRRLALQKEVEERWERLAKAASSQVSQGRISEVDQAEAQLNALKARQTGMGLAAERASRERELVVLTGQPDPPQPLPAGLLDSLPDVPPVDSLVARAGRSSPVLSAHAKELAAARVHVELEQQVAAPTFNLSVGYEREVEGYHLVGGAVEVPLALFNRNQAAVRKARSSLRAAELRKAADEAGLKAEAAARHARLTSLAERYGLYQGQVRDLVRKQLALSEKGFREGLLGVFELSRVQAAYLAQEGEALDILAEYYREWSRLSTSMGGGI